ncbi:MAG: methylenetetrahydrofolate reductase [Thermodesulfobacteriota bacterium]
MRLMNLLNSDSFSIIVEMKPPKGVDVSDFLLTAKKLKWDVSGFLVPDMSQAVLWMSALGASFLLASKGFPVIMEMGCRDRNRLALQADLLSAAACGIENILVSGGVETRYGDHPEAATVADLGVMELVSAAAGLEKGRDMSGGEIKGSPRFFLGAELSAGVSEKDLDREMAAMEKKLDAGVRFFVTTPVFDAQKLAPFMDLARKRSAKILPRVVMLRSLGMARYIQRHMEHIHLPEETIARLMASGDRERECARITAETINAMEELGSAGVILETFGSESRVPEVLSLRRELLAASGEDGAGREESSWGKYRTA